MTQGKDDENNEHISYTVSLTRLPETIEQCKQSSRKGGFTVAELRQLGKELNIPYYHRLKKRELCQQIITMKNDPLVTIHTTENPFRLENVPQNINECVSENDYFHLSQLSREENISTVHKDKNKLCQSLISTAKEKNVEYQPMEQEDNPTEWKDYSYKLCYADPRRGGLHVDRLREIAKELNIPGYQGMSKANLCWNIYQVYQTEKNGKNVQNVPIYLHRSKNKPSTTSSFQMETEKEDNISDELDMDELIEEEEEEEEKEQSEIIRSRIQYPSRSSLEKRDSTKQIEHIVNSILRLNPSLQGTRNDVRAMIEQLLTTNQMNIESITTPSSLPSLQRPQQQEQEQEQQQEQQEETQEQQEQEKKEDIFSLDETERVVSLNDISEYGIPRLFPNTIEQFIQNGFIPRFSNQVKSKLIPTNLSDSTIQSTIQDVIYSTFSQAPIVNTVFELDYSELDHERLMEVLEEYLYQQEDSIVTQSITKLQQQSKEIDTDERLLSVNDDDEDDDDEQKTETMQWEDVLPDWEQTIETPELSPNEQRIDREELPSIQVLDTPIERKHRRTSTPSRTSYKETKEDEDDDDDIYLTDEDEDDL